MEVVMPMPIAPTWRAAFRAPVLMATQEMVSAAQMITFPQFGY